MQMNYATITNQGKRDKDEDAIITLQSEIIWNGKQIETGVFALADGMGGCSAGEEASRIAVQEFVKEFAQILWRDRPLEDFQVKHMLVKAFRNAHEAIQTYGSKKGHDDIGTTLVAAVIQGRNLWVASIGDSAAFLYRTRDKSAASEMTLVEGIRYGLTNVCKADRDASGWLTRALCATEKDSRPSIRPVTLNPGDLVCLCCDGISETVPREEIEKIIESGKSPEEICRMLVVRAEENGGTDNESAIVVKVDAQTINGAKENIFFP
jgi:protein phosphatase